MANRVLVRYAPSSDRAVTGRPVTLHTPLFLDRCGLANTRLASQHDAATAAGHGLHQGGAEQAHFTLPPYEYPAGRTVYMS
jgi:hypothetical protein